MEAGALTGGLIGARLTGVAGASDVFVGGIVSYASRVKFALLDVPDGPVVSPEAAGAMAIGVRRVLGADVGIAATGVAGPTEQEGREVGTVCFGIAIGDVVTTHEVRLPGQRNLIRELSVISLLAALRQRLLTEGN